MKRTSVIAPWWPAEQSPSFIQTSVHQRCVLSLETVHRPFRVCKRSPEGWFSEGCCLVVWLLLSEAQPLWNHTKHRLIIWSSHEQPSNSFLSLLFQPEQQSFMPRLAGAEPAVRPLTLNVLGEQLWWSGCGGNMVETCVFKMSWSVNPIWFPSPGQDSLSAELLLLGASRQLTAVHLPPPCGHPGELHLTWIPSRD